MCMLVQIGPKAFPNKEKSHFILFPSHTLLGHFISVAQSNMGQEELLLTCRYDYLATEQWASPMHTTTVASFCKWIWPLINNSCSKPGIYLGPSYHSSKHWRQYNFCLPDFSCIVHTMSDLIEKSSVVLDSIRHTPFTDLETRRLGKSCALWSFSFPVHQVRIIING